MNNKIKLPFQLSEKVLLNEAIIISNREVFDYEHKDREKRHKLHDKQSRKKAQTGKENINITDTD